MHLVSRLPNPLRMLHPQISGPNGLESSLHGHATNVCEGILVFIIAGYNHCVILMMNEVKGEEQDDEIRDGKGEEGNGKKGERR